MHVNCTIILVTHENHLSGAKYFTTLPKIEKRQTTKNDTYRTQYPLLTFLYINLADGEKAGALQKATPLK